MAVVTITVRDADDGKVGIVLHSEPPVNPELGDDGLTDAQHAAATMMHLFEEYQDECRRSLEDDITFCQFHPKTKMVH